MNEWIGSITDALGDYRFLALYGLSLLAGFFLLKGKRKLFLVPAAVMTVLVLNPLVRDLWNRMNDETYWRMIWIIPVIPVCAAVPSGAIERTNNVLIKATAVILSIVLIIFVGSFVYNSNGTGFAQAQNAEKLPANVEKIAEALLEMDEQPRVVSDIAISIYLRQYSGKIQSPYGRDITYGSPSGLGRNTYNALYYEDFEKLSQMMRSYNYPYLVTYNESQEKRERLETAGFEFRTQVNSYGIYQVKAP